MRVETSTPHRLISAWLNRKGLRLPPPGFFLPADVEQEVIALAESAEGKAFQAAFAMNPELVEPS